ncbi:hypothetical protein E2562_018436 [Oryza meyeriana var. granulata]|uniref:Uncharacterized protein n=1 Tax=Oryza meyeriana var. granulata TaxID=110450 RepID=A0A6G1EMC3_9ORYZ|nr:hypothetical protein E2562_018436 [Oryza meyeriana var. granulata]
MKGSSPLIDFPSKSYWYPNQRRIRGGRRGVPVQHPWRGRGVLARRPSAAKARAAARFGEPAAAEEETAGSIEAEANPARPEPWYERGGALSGAFGCRRVFGGRVVLVPAAERTTTPLAAVAGGRRTPDCVGVGQLA